jgi:hypothetical protein
MISLIVLSLLAFVGIDVYWNIKERHDKFIPVAEIITTDPHAFEHVKTLMADMKSRHREIKSIWLYSWPDAANVDVVHQVGDTINPLPVGHFWTADAHDVGKLSMDVCTELNRNLRNTACSIIGNGDSWGVIVVVWDEEKPHPANHVGFVQSFARRISHLLYGDN